ncbi:MAG: hypothetical protein ACXVBE_16990 [Bdellovibrionota bacterium]
MKTLFAALVLTLTITGTAKADIITCYQTEPFITETFNTDTGTARITDSVMKKSRIVRNVEMVIQANSHIQFRANGKVLREIDLSKEGTDGMSETVYPISSTANNGLWGGGCESNELKAKKHD